MVIRPLMIPSTSSVAVAPGSVYVPPTGSTIGLSPSSVMEGAVTSTTFTVRVFDAALPELSETRYVTR